VFERNFTYRYSSAQHWEFLVFTATDYLLNARKLLKLERLTGMVLVQIESNQGTSKIWFGRMTEPRSSRQKNMTDSIPGEPSKNTKKQGNDDNKIRQ
jgi:hypothetical protein